MNESEQRERFEAFLLREIQTFQLNMRMERFADDIPYKWCGSYEDAHVETAWKAWIESARQSAPITERVTVQMPEPGEGFEILTSGTMIMPGDEFWCHNKWKTTAQAGDIVGDKRTADYYRRATPNTFPSPFREPFTNPASGMGIKKQ